MNKITDIIVSKETVSDDVYKVTSILFENGAQVKKGEIIGSFETSKADVDIESPESGFIFYNCRIGDNVKVGSLFGCISLNDKLPSSYFTGKQPENIDSETGGTGNIRISKPAMKLLAEHNIDIKSFKGKSIIEKKDVEEYLRGNYSNSIPKNTVESSKSLDNKVIIIGGGNHTKVCIDILRQMHVFELSGIVYTKIKPNSDTLGYPILGGLEELDYLYKNVAKNAIVGIGGLENPSERMDLYKQLKNIGFRIPNIIHPRAIIEPSAILGEGNQIMGGANIGSFANIGSNCIINSNSVISHDCIIGDHVHITPGAVLAGTVTVGAGSIIGMGVTVYYNCQIGENVVVTNGHHIFKNIQSNTIIK